MHLNKRFQGLWTFGCREAFLGRRLFLSITRRRLLASIIEMFKLVRLRLRNLEFIETYAWLEVFFLSSTTCKLGRPLFPIIKKAAHFWRPMWVQLFIIK